MLRSRRRCIVWFRCIRGAGMSCAWAEAPDRILPRGAVYCSTKLSAPVRASSLKPAGVVRIPRARRPAVAGLAELSHPATRLLIFFSRLARLVLPWAVGITPGRRSAVAENEAVGDRRPGTLPPVRHNRARRVRSGRRSSRQAFRNSRPVAPHCGCRPRFAAARGGDLSRRCDKMRRHSGCRAGAAFWFGNRRWPSCFSSPSQSTDESE
jgi:hypothetical protein